METQQAVISSGETAAYGLSLLPVFILQTCHL